MHYFFQALLTIVTGWVLGEGPCGERCSISDVGRSTVTSRNHMLDMNGDVYFGNWTFKGYYTPRNTTYSVITGEVSKRLFGEVAAVNVPLKWEQEIAEVVLDVAPYPTSMRVE